MQFVGVFFHICRKFEFLISQDSAATCLMPMTHTPKLAPETSARKLASVSGASVMQSGAECFWRQILESNRTMFYFG